MSLKDIVSLIETHKKVNEEQYNFANKKQNNNSIKGKTITYQRVDD